MVRHRIQFRPAEHSTGGVLRVAEYQHAQARIRGGLVGGEVEHPPRAVVAHRVGDQATAGVLDGAHEGRIGWKLQQNRVTRLAERHDRGEAGLHQIADRDRVGGIRVPAETSLHAADKGLGQHTLARGIAIFLVLGQARQRGGDRWRHAEIHVGDPGRQHVRWKLVPLVGAPRPQRGDVEVGCSGSCHALALRCRAHCPRGGADERT